MLKTAVLHDQGVAFTPWGIAIVKAVVLAKFMLVGNALKIELRLRVNESVVLDLLATTVLQQEL
jgi:hypothetical protein